MLRLLTYGETSTWLDHCRAYVMQEFGDDSCSSMENWRKQHDEGGHVHQAYGDFDTSPPTLLGLVTCIPITHAELAALKSHQLRDSQVMPWRPGEEGPVVLWVDVVISDAPGIATKCIAGVLDQLDRHPCKPLVDTISMFCTGAQGYLMAQTFGLQPIGVDYKEGWPFMERAITPHELNQAGDILYDTWNITKAKDVIEVGRARWGPHWKDKPVL